MNQFVFPAVFFPRGDEIVVLFPDLGITTEGDTIEEAFLFAKDYLRVYCTYAVKHELEIVIPTKFEKVCENNKDGLVMLIDTFVGE